MVARDADKLRRFEDEIRQKGGEATSVPADVSKADDITRAFATIKRDLGAVDVLLYNAAMRPFGVLMETKPSTF